LIVGLHSFLTLAPDGGERSGLHSGRFQPGKKAGDNLIRGCEGSRDGLEIFESVFVLLNDAVSVCMIHRVIR
jgi:hypothetical protein